MTNEINQPDMKPAVAYLRVSTKQQGESGLGLEAQRETVFSFVERNGYQLVNGREFVEVESGSKDNRPQLQRALAACRHHGVHPFGEDEGTVDGARYREAFLHPRDTGGMLVQFVWEERRGSWL